MLSATFIQSFKRRFGEVRHYRLRGRQMKTATLTAELGQRRRYSLSHELTRSRDVVAWQMADVTYIHKFDGTTHDYIAVVHAASDEEAFRKLGYSLTG